MRGVGVVAARCILTASWLIGASAMICLLGWSAWTTREDAVPGHMASALRSRRRLRVHPSSRTTDAADGARELQERLVRHLAETDASWQAWDWQRPIGVQPASGCAWVNFAPPHAVMNTSVCLHGGEDLLTAEVRAGGFWRECADLPAMLERTPSSTPEVPPLFVDVGVCPLVPDVEPANGNPPWHHGAPPPALKARAHTRSPTTSPVRRPSRSALAPACRQTLGHAVYTCCSQQQRTLWPSSLGVRARIERFAALPSRTLPRGQTGEFHNACTQNTSGR